MKKSKIIVPALGILAFSTAAAVTGTVAWFTANRTATINNTAITAFNPEAGLAITLSNNTAGVTLTTPGAGQAVAATHGLLRDASVDVVNGEVWKSVIGADGQVASFEKIVTSGEGANPNYEAGTNAASAKYYYANKYSANFALTNGQDSASFALLYDNDQLSTTVAEGTAKNIQQALRIGIKVGDEYLVIAPFRSAADGTSVNYVKNSVLSAEKGSYESVTLYSATKNTNGIGASAATSTLTANVGYLATLNSTTNNVTGTVFTWFEGLDPQCVNEQVDGLALSAQLSFRLVKIAD